MERLERVVRLSGLLGLEMRLQDDTDFKALHAGLPPHDGAPGQRVTLVIAWWGRGLRAQTGAPGSGPAQALGSAEAVMQHYGQTWLEELTLPPSMGPSEGSWHSAATVQQPWSAIPVQQVTGRTGARTGVPLPCLRFALRSAHEFAEVYVRV